MSLCKNFKFIVCHDAKKTNTHKDLNLKIFKNFNSQKIQFSLEILGSKKAL